MVVTRILTPWYHRMHPIPPHNHHSVLTTFFLDPENFVPNTFINKFCVTFPYLIHNASFCFCTFSTTTKHLSFLFIPLMFLRRNYPIFFTSLRRFVKLISNNLVQPTILQISDKHFIKTQVNAKMVRYRIE